MWIFEVYGVDTSTRHPRKRRNKRQHLLWHLRLRDYSGNRLTARKRCLDLG